MRTLAASLLAFARAGCATTSGRAGADVEAVRATLSRVDAEVSKSAQEQGLAEAFASYAAPDAMMMPANQNPLTGREAIRNHFADAPPETTFVWKPFAAEVARSGALGLYARHV